MLSGAAPFVPAPPSFPDIRPDIQPDIFPTMFPNMDEWSQLGLDLGERSALEAEVLMWRLWSGKTASH
jgi:hypothetical protein